MSDGFSFVLVALVAGIFGLVSIRHVPVSYTHLTLPTILRV